MVRFIYFYLLSPCVYAYVHARAHTHIAQTIIFQTDNKIWFGLIRYLPSGSPWIHHAFVDKICPQYKKGRQDGFTSLTDSPFLQRWRIKAWLFYQKIKVEIKSFLTAVLLWYYYNFKVIKIAVKLWIIFFSFNCKIVKIYRKWNSITYWGKSLVLSLI